MVTQPSLKNQSQIPATFPPPTGEPQHAPSATALRGEEKGRGSIAKRHKSTMTAG